MTSRLSIRWRLTIFNALTILAIEVLLVGVLLVVTFRAVQSGVEETVERRASQVVRLLETEAQPDDALLDGYVDQGFLLIVRDGQGTVLAEIDRNPARYDVLDADQRSRLWQTVVATDAVAVDRPRELYGYGIPVDTGLSQARVVEVWRSYDEAANEVVPFLPIVTFAIPLSLVFAIGGSYIHTRNALAPVSVIDRAARRIGATDLSQRLPVPNPRDELGRLATTFNGLLARLDLAFRQQEDDLQRQRRFVADASHELRTPLTSIEGYANLLDRWGLDDPAVGRESAAAIVREAARMRRLIDDLLDLAHGDEHEEISRAPADLCAIAQDAVTSARMAAAGRVAILYAPPEVEMPLSVDADRIRQVLGILLDNAAKHGRDGGTVTLRLEPEREAVRLVVADDGPGIDETHLPHLFERFYRVDAARTSGGTASGSGLGLAIAQRIVERHGGQISVESRVGAGSTFTVTLPCSAEGA